MPALRYKEHLRGMRGCLYEYASVVLLKEVHVATMQCSKSHSRCLAIPDKRCSWKIRSAWGTLEVFLNVTYKSNDIDQGAICNARDDQ